MKVILPALAAALLTVGVAHAQNNEKTNPTTTTTKQEAQRGVPGVDVDMNRNRVDMSVGAEGDQKNVDTKRMGADADKAGTNTRAARADRN